MDQTRAGVTYGVGAYALWGLFPLFWPLLEPSSPVEVLAHRVLWSLVVVAVLVRVTRGWAALRAVPREHVRRLMIASVLLTVNWGLYIYGVNSGQVVETSLGYFINPLVSVLLGVVVLGERLRPIQLVAIGFAVASVLVLTVALARPPWIALSLAFSFGTYGLLKKQAGVGALASLGIESATTGPVAVVYLAVLALLGHGTFTTHGPDHAGLLAATGVVTVVPLLLFGAAATRVPLTTLGLLQYLTPSMQLLIGVSVRHEPFGRVRVAGFVLVWVALGLFTADFLRHRRAVSVAEW
ncbi:MAG TPA: EamA family transporter RarD [Mycobacteriales bacterium]|nr:EamA family transporter RarD [Mycobacteriales bacterium]